MKPLRLLTLLAACCATSTVIAAWSTANAAEPAPARSTTPAAAGESAVPKTDEQTQVQQGTNTEEDEAAKAPPAKAKSSGKASPERFVPSEQVRADFDVSFPIDI